jgi:alkylated DNA repair dioxygenase AlkB
MQDVGALRGLYAERRHVFMAGAAELDVVESVRKDLQTGVRRRVCVNEDASATWDSLDYAGGSWVHRRFFAPAFIAFIAGITDIEPARFNGLVAWVHVYRKGEYIGRHKDCEGACQLVIGVESDCARTTGLLHIAGQEEYIYRLEPGDLLLFEATSLAHWTTPLAPRLPGTTASRSVLVVRYYCEERS